MLENQVLAAGVHAQMPRKSSSTFPDDPQIGTFHCLSVELVVHEKFLHFSSEVGQVPIFQDSLFVCLFVFF